MRGEPPNRCWTRPCYLTRLPNWRLHPAPAPGPRPPAPRTRRPKDPDPPAPGTSHQPRKSGLRSRRSSSLDRLRALDLHLRTGTRLGLLVSPSKQVSHLGRFFPKLSRRRVHHQNTTRRKPSRASQGGRRVRRGEVERVRVDLPRQSHLVPPG